MIDIELDHKKIEDFSEKPAAGDKDGSLDDTGLDEEDDPDVYNLNLQLDLMDAG